MGLVPSFIDKLSLPWWIEVAKNMWVQLSHRGVPIAIAIVYMAVEGLDSSWNDAIYRCLQADIAFFLDKGFSILLLGD